MGSHVHTTHGAFAGHACARPKELAQMFQEIAMLVEARCWYSDVVAEWPITDRVASEATQPPDDRALSRGNPEHQ